MSSIVRARELRFTRQSSEDNTIPYEKIGESEYGYKQREYMQCPFVSTDMKVDYDTNGYLIIRSLLSKDELDKLCLAVVQNKNFWNSACSCSDAAHKQFRQVLWNEAGGDILGAISGTAKTVGVCEQLLNKGELYLYRGKLIRKKPQEGGTIDWHQDYGYWYRDGAIFPDFVSLTMALTSSKQDNGGIQVLKGSHQCGRINHEKVMPSQHHTLLAADLERVELIEKALETVDIDLNPGDAIIYHANLLHKSGPNLSEKLRWHLIFSYNCKDNIPENVPEYQYRKLQRYPANILERCDSIQIDARKYLDVFSH